MRRLSIIIFLALLCSCNSPDKNSNGGEAKSDSFSKSVSTSHLDKTGGTVYFSSDNGLTWENKSRGLPVKIIEDNPGTFIFYKWQLCIGTQSGGLFCSSNRGKIRANLNTGLANLTIRKLVQTDNRLYAGTNAGLYSFNESLRAWELEYGNNKIQVNGITELDGSIYIGTNQGAYTSPKGRKEWIQILTSYTLHNVSSDQKKIYAMTYNGR